MMTVEEFIDYSKRIAKAAREIERNKDLIKEDKYVMENCSLDVYADEYEQLAKWLEHYQELFNGTEQEIYERGYAEGAKQGYKDGVTDLSKQLRVYDGFCISEELVDGAVERTYGGK